MSAQISPQDLVERTLDLSTADGCVVLAEETSEANLRWAANTLTTNGVMRGRRLTVVATVGSGEGTASGVVSRSNVDRDEIEALVRAAEKVAREAEPAEDANPLVEGSGAGSAWRDGPAETSIEVFTRLAADLGDWFTAARGEGRDTYGFAEHVVRTTYLGISTGLRLRHAQPTGRIEVTAKDTGTAASTWAGRATRDFTDVSVAEIDAELVRGLTWGRRRVDLPAGRYDTVLPPGAVADLLIYLYWTMAARDAHDGRTVFSTPGGGTRVGERLSERPVRLWSDPQAEQLQCDPFVAAAQSSAHSSVFDNGLPIGATDWLRDGVLEALIQTRHSASMTGLAVTPAIDNLLFGQPGATRAVDDLVGDVQRGLLLNCLWYIREVDPQTLLLTGLTRDGVYLVEGGEVVGAVNNFRFNESPVDLLSRISDVGATEVTLAREFGDYFTRTAMPAVRVPDFNMSSVSQAS
jgi:predicted Zn-dependent protease